MCGIAVWDIALLQIAYGAARCALHRAVHRAWWCIANGCGYKWRAHASQVCTIAVCVYMCMVSGMQRAMASSAPFGMGIMRCVCGAYAVAVGVIVHVLVAV